MRSPVIDWSGGHTLGSAPLPAGQRQARRRAVGEARGAGWSSLELAQWASSEPKHNRPAFGSRPLGCAALAFVRGSAANSARCILLCTSAANELRCTERIASLQHCTEALGRRAAAPVRWCNAARCTMRVVQHCGLLLSSRPSGPNAKSKTMEREAPASRPNKLGPSCSLRRRVRCSSSAQRACQRTERRPREFLVADKLPLAIA